MFDTEGLHFCNTFSVNLEALHGMICAFLVENFSSGNMKLFLSQICITCSFLHCIIEIKIKSTINHLLSI